jgi:hypothetical protein
MPSRLSRVRLIFGLIGFVAGSSLLGLAMAMTVGGFPLFRDVWAANWLGDVVFVAGMASVGLAAFLLAAKRRQWQSLALAFVGTWAIFGASFLLTGPDMPAREEAREDGSGADQEQDAPPFSEPLGPFEEDAASVWEFVFVWGWPGLVWGTFSPAAAALALRLRLAGPIAIAHD